MSSAYKKLRKYHHDTNKRFMYINECIRNEKYDAIIPYLESSMDELNSSYSKINTGNLVIDSFVSNYLLFAEDNNIDFQPDLQIDATIIPINDYDLSINKYKQTEYKPVEYPPTGEILAKIKALETEIGKELSELEEMLK